MRRWLPVLLMLAACASEPPLEVRLQPLVGKTEAELVQAFGVPTSTYQAADARFLQYEDQTTPVYPGDPFWGRGYTRFGSTFAAPPLVVTRRCAVTFTLRQGRVEGFTHRGNGCR